MCDRFTVLRDGETVGSGVTADTPNEQIIALMVGRNVEELYPRSPRTAGEVILEVKNLCGVTKPKSASLQLRRGEILGISGLVGAGRTELMRAIFGLNSVTSGDIRVGTLDDPDQLPPDIHIFTASKQPWVLLPPGVPQVPEYYDSKKLWPAASLERRRLLFG